MIRVLLPTHLHPQVKPNAGLRKSIYFLVLSSLLVFGLLPAASLACQTSSTASDSRAESDQWAIQISPGVSLLGQADPWARLKQICVSPDGSFLAAANTAGELEIIRLSDWRTLATHSIQPGQIHRMKFRPDSSMLAMVTLAQLTQEEKLALDVDDATSQPIVNWLHIFEDDFAAETKHHIPVYKFGTRGNATIVDLINGLSFSQASDQLLLTGTGGPRVFRIQDREFDYFQVEDLRADGFFVSDDLVYFPGASKAWNLADNQLTTYPELDAIASSRICDTHEKSNWHVLASGSQAFLFNSSSARSQNDKRVDLQKAGQILIARLSGDLSIVAGIIKKSAKQNEVVVWDAKTGERIRDAMIPDVTPMNLGITNDRQLLVEVYQNNNHKIVNVDIGEEMQQQLTERLSRPTVTSTIQLGNQNRMAVLNNGTTLLDLETGERNWNLPLGSANYSNIQTDFSDDQPLIWQFSEEANSFSLVQGEFGAIADPPKVSEFEVVRKSGAATQALLNLFGGTGEQDYLNNLAMAVDQKNQTVITVMYGSVSKIRIMQYDMRTKKVTSTNTVEESVPMKYGLDQLASISGNFQTAALATQEDWQVVSIADNKTIAEIPRQKENVIVLSNDGRFMITAHKLSTDSAWCSDVKITDLKTRKVIKEFDQPVLFAAAKNQDRMALVDRQGRVELWEPSSGEMIQSIGDCQAEPTAIEISSDGKMIICGLSDTRLQQWNLEEMQEESKR